MRAAYYEEYGVPEVLRVGRLPDPRPTSGEVLVRVHASAVNPKDVLTRKGKFKLFTRNRFPRVPGQDFAGTIEAVGEHVRGLRVGDEVFGMVNSWDGGTAAELVLCPHTELAKKLPDTSMAEAASIPLVGMTALQALRDLMHVTDGESVCINGASGGVGTAAVQIAKILGARVTAVCSARNADFVRELCADVVVPYDETPIVESGLCFDVFFDVFGSAPYPVAQPLLADGGRFVTAIPGARQIVRDLATRWTKHPARLVAVRSRTRDLQLLRRWIQIGLLRPIIDRTYSLDEIADAHRYIETKRARGKVIVAVSSASRSE